MSCFSSSCFIFLLVLFPEHDQGCSKEFSSLKALITHHSVMPEQLPVPLALPRPKNLLQRRNLDDFEPYSSLSDFQNLMIQT